MSEYTVPISIDNLKNLTKNLVPYSYNKAKFNIRGKFMPFIEKYVKKYEKIDAQLKAGNAVVYKESERSNTPYLRIKHVNMLLFCQTIHSNIKIRIQVKNILIYK